MTEESEPGAQSIHELIDTYRRSAEGTSVRDPSTVNKYHDVLHKCYLELRRTHAGRESIIILMSNPNRHVRLWAAAHSLAWVPEKAKAVLIALRDESGPGAFDAGITLDEFEKGTLSFDY